ncbi:MAG: WecB/TagA/CpsF family glycosyltransferase [Lentimicrobiaceae bacterium]|nr:WecB/TagA/CpsF family glycosyltransferase [Lentimicrobiaceae bacterium]MCB9023063.1 WecB/TagA/CpsF family glycosyltransferase [Lentimicrobiaceae bacterium]MCO5264587.1 WecB/TagA/CpsF family glycosyltransferase [Lentimicrobium sp.]
MKQKFYFVHIDLLNTREALETCSTLLKGPKSSTLFFINAHCFNIAVRNKQYYNSLQQADLLLNDGIGMKIASWFAGIRFKENMNGTDFIPKLIDQAHSISTSVYLLGAKPGIASIAAEKINNRAKSKLVVGYSDGYFNQNQESEIIDSIRQSKAGLLILGMGVPMQELWISEHIHKLPDVKLAVAGGAIIDFMSGNIKRAPRWMQTSGLEWFYRFLHEPARLFNRYFIGNFVFFANILKFSLSKSRDRH